MQTCRFENALYALVQSIGANRLEPVLGIQQKYISRMANPNDSGAYFRARDLAATMRMGQKLFPGSPISISPLAILAGDLDHALYPLPRVAHPRAMIQSLAGASTCMGDLGSHTFQALDPDGPGGSTVLANELVRIRDTGIVLISTVASIMRQAEQMEMQS